jgi:hypothetical protein
MPWRCPVCGAINDDDAEFCTQCGAPRPENPEYVEAPALAEPREPAGGEEAQEHTTEQRVAAEEPAEEERAEEQPAEPGSGGEEASTPTALPAEEKPVEEEAPTPQQLYIEIVNTPAHELLGKKIPLMLNVFPKITLGRSPESVIVIPDPTVSRRHAVIEQRSGKIVLRDLGSTNGTYVYDEETGGFERVEEVELRPGLLIRLGESTIIRIVAE